MRISNLLARASDPRRAQLIGQLDRWAFGADGGGEVREKLNPKTQSYMYDATVTSRDPDSSFRAV